MNGLYPIIRRKRRPLIDSDNRPTAVVENVKAVEPVAAVEPEAPKVEKQKVSDAKVSSNRNSR